MSEPLPVVRLKNAWNSTHPWIFQRLVEKPAQRPKPGSIVDVEGVDGTWIGRGFYNGHSRIALRMLERDHGGFPVSRLEHSLQTATRAEEDGRDEEYVLCALIHDIGDTLAPYNHPSIAAGLLKPFVSEANHWMVEHHGIFQGYYFWHYIGADRNARDAFRDSPYYEYTEEFCAKYDQTAFDPNYISAPLSHYEPLIRQYLVPKEFADSYNAFT